MYVAIHICGLLPHFFTLTLRRLFSVTIYLNLHPAVLSTESCSALSGLSSLASDRATHRCKGNKKGDIIFFIYICTALTLLGGAFWLRLYPIHLIRIMPAKGKRRFQFIPPCYKLIIMKKLTLFCGVFFISILSLAQNREQNEKRFN